MGENEMVKIRFRLLQGADGYPPCDSEGLWATPLGGGAYRVALARSATDIVATQDFRLAAREWR